MWINARCSIWKPLRFHHRAPHQNNNFALCLTQNGKQKQQRSRRPPFQLRSSFYSTDASPTLPGTQGAEHADVSLQTDRHIREGLKNMPTMEFPKPDHVTSRNLSIENLQYVGSYSWSDHSEPTIIVPGSPLEWCNVRFPITVEKAHGPIFVNQDAYRVPASPLLPLFRAADAVANDYPQYAVDWPSVDFITSSDTLRTLLWWILDSSGDFRIDMQLAGTHTVLLDSWAPRTTEDASLSESYVRGFKRKSATLPEGLAGTTEHQRIVQFKFGGLNMVERFGVDACTPPRKRDALPPIPIADEDKSAPSPAPDAILGAWLQPAQPGTSTDVAVVRGGVPAAQVTLVQLEIGLRNSPTGTNWSDAYPSLFLSHTPLHFVAVHNGSGTFNGVIKHRLNSHTLKRVKARQQTGFKRLRLALQGIQELAVARGREGRLSLVCEDGRMQVYERASMDGCVPKDILARFYRKA